MLVEGVGGLNPQPCWPGLVFSASCGTVGQRPQAIGGYAACCRSMTNHQHCFCPTCKAVCLCLCQHRAPMSCVPARAYMWLCVTSPGANVYLYAMHMHNAQSACVCVCPCVCLRLSACACSRVTTQWSAALCFAQVIGGRHISALEGSSGSRLRQSMSHHWCPAHQWRWCALHQPEQGALVHCRLL